MKKLVCLIIVSVVLLFSFAKDTQTDENLVPKKAIPMKGVVCMTENNADRMPVANTPVIHPGTGEILVPELTLARFATLSGHLTHMGNINMGQSSMTGVSAYLDLAALAKGRIVFVAEYIARITGANGDYVDLESLITIDATDDVSHSHAIINGTYTVTGGSGKFEDATGSGVFSGVLPCWNVDGTLVCSK
jgi:hypothetical protein